jgi:cell shape-determining protein MreD
MSSPVAPLTVAVVGALALILGLVLDLPVLWAIGVAALVLALALFLYTQLIAPRRGRRTRR